MATASSLEKDQLSNWCDFARSLGFRDFLTPEDGFRRCMVTGKAWTNAKSPGIYFWLAEDGRAYVGQSITPQARLRTHWRDHRDIVQACFLPCSSGELDQVEEDLISRAGKHYSLRNIKMAVATAREVPFDNLTSPAEREAFLNGETLPTGNWRDMEFLAGIQNRKFQQLLRSPWAVDALRRVQLFVERVIPKPNETELGFWSITIFPSRGFIRLNVGQQEVFTFEARDRHVRIFSDTQLGIVGSRRARYRVESYENIVAAQKLDAWVTGSRLLACRSLVVRLMRHTSAMNSGSHCPQMVRHFAGDVQGT